MDTNLTFNDLPTAVKRLTNEVSELKSLLLRKQESTPTNEAEKLLTIKEASEFLKLSVPTLYSKVSKNELPYMKQGKRLYFSSIELMEYIKEGRSKTSSEIEAEADTYLSNKRKGLK
ncbi:MAG: helix-turn-helix domain-containing protein [Flavobacteriaceae bacterium]|nr:helix-turn-helix domain-containing protein [Flavobacteriaceae bacterium]